MIVDFPVCKELPEHMSDSIQTRSETTGIRFFGNLTSALLHCVNDKTVWKISYMTPMGWRRFVIR